MQGPMIAEICGTAPEARLFSENFAEDRVTEALLDARAERIEQPYHRHAQSSAPLYHVSDLSPLGAADSPGQHGAVLRVYVNEPAVYLAIAGNHPVGRFPLFRHAEIHVRVSASMNSSTNFRGPAVYRSARARRDCLARAVFSEHRPFRIAGESLLL